MQETGATGSPPSRLGQALLWEITRHVAAGARCRGRRGFAWPPLQGSRYPRGQEKTRSVAPALHTVGLLLAVAVMGCQSPVGVPGAVELVTSFRVDPVVNTFVEPVNIRYSLRQPAFVTLRVVAEAAAEGKRYLVFPIQDKQKETSGTHHAAWLGTATDGFFVPKGKYLIELYAQATPEAKTQEYAVQVYIYRN